MRSGSGQRGSERRGRSPLLARPENGRRPAPWTAVVAGVVAWAVSGVGGGGPAEANAQEPTRRIGLELMERLDRLPDLHPGVSAKQVASHDRSGGNDDGAVGTYSYLRMDFARSELVLFDEQGPGCLYRIWMTDSASTYFEAFGPEIPSFWMTGNIRFYFDGEETPRVDVPLRDFFSGTVAPFLAPLVGDKDVSSGGFYSYVPMPFEKSLVVTTTGPATYYDITYHTYEDATGVKSFEPDHVDSSRVRAMWENAGEDPKGAPAGSITSGEIEIPAGGERDLLAIAGGGTIGALEIRSSPVNDEALEDLWLRIHWEGEKEPSVLAPVGEFFLAGLGVHEARALAIGMRADGTGYSYFPMPFAGEARVVLENRGSRAVAAEYRIAHRAEAYEGLGTTAGWFHATRAAEAPTTEGLDFAVFSGSGTGHVVGVSSTMASVGTTSRVHLEGDERIHFDGSRSPAIHGTGTEDYFNGGWYFLYGPFDGPAHGSPAHEVTAVDRTAAYRLHLSDLLPFSSGIRFGIEHGPQNDVPGDYSSVVYWYGIDEPSISQTDEIDVGSVESEGVHGYVVTGETWSGEKAYQFQGDSDEFVTEDGRAFTGSSRFTVAIDPGNAGVRLRRLTELVNDDQQARVYVNGAELPIPWSVPAQRTHNDLLSPALGPVPLPGKEALPGKESSRRWVETNYEIPAEYTAGRDSITVEVRPSTGLIWESWSEYRYWAFSRIR